MKTQTVAIADVKPGMTTWDGATVRRVEPCGDWRGTRVWLQYPGRCEARCFSHAIEMVAARRIAGNAS